MFENAHRSPLTITFNNVQYLNGEHHPTCATIKCTPGVYMSAVKPGLQSIYDGWSKEISGVLITCTNLSNREEASKRDVCTKLVLLLTISYSEQAKVVLHFYHTASSLLVQGSNVMPEGISSAAWLVKHFLEPIANEHITANRDTIQALNANIISGAQDNCSSCHQTVNFIAHAAKDQGLTCSKCNKTFHKKCTDRKKLTKNWQKQPWYCPACILEIPNNINTSNNVPHNDLAMVTNLNPVAGVFLPALQLPDIHPLQGLQLPGLLPGPQPPSNLPLTGLQPHGELPGVHSSGLLTGVPVQPPGHLPDIQSPGPLPGLQPPAPLPGLQAYGQLPGVQSPGLLPSAQPAKQPSQPPNQPTIRFPNNSIRQKSSNINLSNPEIEFQKTALNACRSTIAQLEAEKKRLNETLSIRNRRIMQLEEQIGHASDYVASRDTDTPTHVTTMY